VTPTEAGARLLERLAPALTEVESALDSLNRFRDSPTGTLRLNVPTVVARDILPPIAVAFLKAYPGITLEVSSEDRFVDVLAAGFDAGVRYGESLERDMVAVPIGPRTQRFVTAAAPSYLTANGRPQHPRDLLNHPCILHRFSSGVSLPWDFKRGEEVVQIRPTGPLVASTLELELAAAIGGLGVIGTFEEFVAPAIANGELEPVLEEWAESFSGPFLYYPSRRHMPAPLRAFIDFIKAWPGGVAPKPAPSKSTPAPRVTTKTAATRNAGRKAPS
jgi:DNA-binding transcriptional LysR family regulator